MVIPENYVMNKMFSSNPEMGCDSNMSSSATNQMTEYTCHNPRASILFDGVIPSVINIKNTECNRQLLRLRHDSISIFNFGKMNPVSIWLYIVITLSFCHSVLAWDFDNGKFLSLKQILF